MSTTSVVDLPKLLVQILFVVMHTSIAYCLYTLVKGQAGPQRL